MHTFDDLFHFVSFRFVPFRFVPFRVLSLAPGGYDKITCGAFLLSQQLFSPLTLYGNHFSQFVSSLADVGAELDRPGKIVPKKS